MISVDSISTNRWCCIFILVLSCCLVCYVVVSDVGNLAGNSVLPVVLELLLAVSQ